MSIAAGSLHRLTVDVYERMASSGLLPERGVELLDGLLVDLQDDVIHVFRNPNADRYDVRRIANPGELISPMEYPDVTIGVAEILGA